MNNPEQLYKILVVDDVPANLKLLSEILSGYGYQVRPASSGSMALRTVAAEAPDLILLDVRMPEMDGYEVCRRLKADEKNRSIPVLFVSALDETTDKVKGFEAGGVDFITKPFQPVEMLKRIETHLSLRHLHQQLEVQNLQLRKEIAERERAEEVLRKQEAHLEELVVARTAALQLEIQGHKQTAETLKDSEQRLADIINLLPDPTFAIDLEGKVIIWNRAAEVFTGIKSEDMLGKGDYEYALPFYGKRRPILVDLVLKPSDEANSSYPRIKSDQGMLIAEAYARSYKGGVVYLLGTAAPLYDARGTVIGAIETLRDITDRRRQEEALRESEERLSQIIDFLPDATFAIDLDGRVIAWNRAIEEMTGVKAEAMLGKGDYAYSVPFYGIQRPILIDLVFKSDAEIQQKYFFVRKEGECLLAEADVPVKGQHLVLSGIARPLSDSKGNLVGAIESIRDITERKRGEEAIREANERFRSVLHAATGYSIIGTDQDGLVKVFNEGAELMLGYSAEEVIDKATPEMIHDPEEIVARAVAIGIEPGFEVLVAAARRGETETREWTYIHKNGSRLTVSLTVTAMHNEAGLLSGFIGMARDITAEKKLEQQFIQSQKMECVGLLAGGVAHDFNNLLTPILGYTELLIRGFSEDDPRHKRLQHVKEAADRAKDLTHRLLTFSRKQIIELKTLDLGDIVCQFEEILHRTIRENIQIDIAIAPSLGKVRIDAGQIELVLLNLSVNAQDAMPEGGKLTIEVKDIDLDAAYAASHAEISPGPYVMLAVSDTGSGMDEKTTAHIFEPFFTTKELGKGTGLGLSTVYGIVKQHGGSIYVYSERERGSVFKVFLPRVEEDGTLIEPSLSRGNRVVSGSETILVAEDSEIVRLLVNDMLESFGYNVLVAESPERCIEIARGYQGTLDLLLTDVVMPGMNGMELIHLLRETRPELKVLFMSGYSSNVIAHHGVLDQKVDFVQKPFTVQSLSEKVRQALDS
jgi:PAS domain S-box-containing protein